MLLLYLQDVILNMLFVQSLIPKLIILDILSYFIYKGMDFIALPYFQRYIGTIIHIKNCEVPIICYKYNEPIRGAIFNSNKVVSDFDIKTCTPDS